MLDRQKLQTDLAWHIPIPGFVSTVFQGADAVGSLFPMGIPFSSHEYFFSVSLAGKLGWQMMALSSYTLAVGDSEL